MLSTYLFCLFTFSAFTFIQTQSFFLETIYLIHLTQILSDPSILFHHFAYFFFFFQVQLVSLRNFAAFWLSLLGIEKHQTHYRFLRWTNFLVLMSKIVFFPELKLFLIHPITILQVNLSYSIWNIEHKNKRYLFIL